MTGATTDYCEEISQAALAEDFEKVGVTINAALKDEAVQEDELAKIATTVLNYKVQSYYQVFQIFCQRYPESISPLHAFYAEFLVLTGRTERGAEESRYFLRKMRDLEILQRTDLDHFYRDGLARAFLYAQSTYIELGARSYCLRVLNLAKSISVLTDFTPEFDKHTTMITKELDDADVRKLDSVWEEFFVSGAHLEAVLAICGKYEWAELARRFELLEGQLRFAAGLTFEKEFFMSVFTTDKNEALLQ